MTDLISVLPNFPTAPYTHLVPSLERDGITVADLLTLDAIEIVKRCPLPLLDVRRLARHVIEALQEDLGIAEKPVMTSDVFLAFEDVSAARSGVQAFRKLLGRTQKISTLDSALDKALGGGIPTGYVTEVTGERRAPQSS